MRSPLLRLFKVDNCVLRLLTSPRHAIVTDLIYRLDRVAHRVGGKKGYALNMMFGDMHVRIQTDKSFFDAQCLWNENVSGTTTGIEDQVDDFRWLIMSFQP